MYCLTRTSFCRAIIRHVVSTSPTHINDLFVGSCVGFLLAMGIAFRGELPKEQRAAQYRDLASIRIVPVLLVRLPVVVEDHDRAANRKHDHTSAAAATAMFNLSALQLDENGDKGRILAGWFFGVPNE